MIKLKDILNEDDIDSKFGNHALTDPDTKIGKHLAKLTNSKPETNTSFEKELLQLLGYWVDNSDAISAEKLWSLKKLFIQVSDKFPKIFRPDTPNGTILYRGIRTISKNMENDLLKISRSGFVQFTIGSNKFWKSETPIHYTPTTKVQSWTSNENVAANSFTDNKRGLLLSTSQNDEFLFNQNAMNLMNQYASSKKIPYEWEILHFGIKYGNPIYVLLGDDYYNNLFGKSLSEEHKQKIRDSVLKQLERNRLETNAK